MKGKSKFGILTVFVMFLILILPIVNSKIEFYDGNIIIDKLDASIDIQDKAEVTLEYVLVNKGEYGEVSLDFSPSEATVLVDGKELVNPISFKKGEEKTISLTYELDVNEIDNVRQLNFVPSLLFNELHNSKSINSYDVKIKLPENVNKLIASSKESSSITSENRRTVYLWDEDNVYTTALTVKWSQLDVDISAEKKAPLKAAVNETLTFKIIIKNNMDKEIKNVKVRDTFLPTDFEAVSEDIYLYDDPASDPHLIWEKNFDLKAGETKTFEYSLKAKRPSEETTFKPLSIFVGDSLVGASNEVTMDVVEKKPSKKYIIYLVIIGIVIITILVFLFYKFKKKPAQMYSY